MQIGPETEIHLLSKLDSVPDEDFTIYHENEVGRVSLEKCQSREECVKYLLSRRGLNLGTKISEQNAQTILANYCCGACNNGKSKH